MKTEIFITGQISGNFKLRNAIITAQATEKKHFNDIILSFPTRKAARIALWSAYKYLRAQEPGIHSGIGGLSYCAKRQINYDASRATIVE